MEHIHPVEDNDLQFNIDVETRTITHPSPESLILVRGDHNSDRFRFEMDRYIDGHDTMLCDKVQVHYINVDGETPETTSSDVYTVDDMAPKEGDDTKIVCSWLIANTATLYAGTLSFALRFSCTKDSKPVYVWNTAPYSGVVVSNGVNSSEAVVSQYGDVLDQWYAEFLNAGATGVRMVNDAIPVAIDEVVEESKKRITADSLSAKDILVHERGYRDDRVMSQRTVTEELDSLTSTMENEINDAVNETRAITNELREDIAKVSILELEPVNPDNDVHSHAIEDDVKYKVYSTKTAVDDWGLNLWISYKELGDSVTGRKSYHIPANQYNEYVTLKVHTRSGAIDITIDGFKHSYSHDYMEIVNMWLEGATKVYIFNENNEFVVKANGIASIRMNGGDRTRNTYTISFDDGSTFDYDVFNGDGITSVERTNRGEYEDTYTIYFTSGKTTTFTVPNAWATGARKTVTGETIKVDDVSPAAHNVKLSVENEDLSNLDTADMRITACGKNLINEDLIVTSFANYGVTVTRDGEFLTLNGAATADAMILNAAFCFNGEKGNTYTASYKHVSGSMTGAISMCIGTSDDPTAARSNWLSFRLDQSASMSKQLTGVYLKDLWFYAVSGATFDNYTICIQLEKGDTATEYESYIGKTYTPNYDGSVSNVLAISPTMTLLSSHEGVNLKMEYLQDINKVLEKAGVSEPIDAYTRQETDALLLGLGREFDVKLDGVDDDIRDLDNAIGTLNDNLFDLEETGEYEDVQVATLPRDAFSLRTGTVRGDTALIEVVPSGTYVLSFESCIEHSGAASLYLNEYTEDNEQVTADKRLDFERTGTGLGSTTALIASLFPNGGRCVMTVGPTTRYIKFMFDAYAGAPERIPSGLKLVYKSPVLAYGDVKVEKLPTKVVSNNLFNKATASTGKNVYLGKNSNGEPLYGWFCNVYNVVATEASGSGFDSTSTAIEIEGGQTYFKSINTIIHYFDANDVWINAPRPDFKARSVVAPENARYVRIGFISSYLDQVQFVKGDKYLPYDEWKMGIENFDSDKSPQIDEVLARNALHLPFMQEYMWEIAEEAHKYTAPNRHTFLFISDTHANSIGNRAMSIAANMTKYVPCSSIIHGGDIIDGMTEKKNELMLLTTLVRNGNDAKCPVYYVKGNHDWNLLYRSMINTSATRDEYILNSELARRTNGFVKNQVHGDVDNMYFYADDETTKIRTIIFNCVNKDESGDRSALDNNVQIWGTAQVEWLINEALNFKDMSDKEDWGVIVVQHQSSGSEFWKILNGFKNGTSGTTTGSDDENLSIPFDFTSQGPMNLIANFVGDIHHDGVPKVGTTPIIMIVNASLANDYADGHAPSNPDALMPADKAFGTENETAFDIVTIDKENHLIYLTRFGARSYAYNSATGKYDKIAARTRVVDYSTGTCTVITED